MTKIEYENLLNQIFNNQIEIINWNGITKKLKYRCKNCNTIYELSDARKLRSKFTHCEKCVKRHNWTKETFLKRCEFLFPTEKIEILSFTGGRSQITIKCCKCQKEEIIPNAKTIFSRTWLCKNCAPSKDKVKQDILKMFESTGDVLLEWNGSRDKAKVKCGRCGAINERYPANIQAIPSVCPHCNLNGGYPYTIEEAQKKINLYMGENQYTVLKYEAMRNNALIQHNCGFIFSIKIHNFIRGRGCPKCFKKQSILERKVMRFLDGKHIAYETQVRFLDCNKGKSSFDFAVTQKNKMILIEVQGQQHYDDIPFLGGLEDNQRRDKIKKDYCKEKNIQLIEIPYWDIDNLDKYFNEDICSSLEKSKD